MILCTFLWMLRSCERQRTYFVRHNENFNADCGIQNKWIKSSHGLPDVFVLCFFARLSHFKKSRICNCFNYLCFIFFCVTFYASGKCRTIRKRNIAKKTLMNASNLKCLDFISGFSTLIANINKTFYPVKALICIYKSTGNIVAFELS